VFKGKTLDIAVGVYS